MHLNAYGFVAQKEGGKKVMSLLIIDRIHKSCNDSLTYSVHRICAVCKSYSLPKEPNIFQYLFQYFFIYLKIYIYIFIQSFINLNYKY